MSVAKYSIELEWKEHNVNLDAVHSWMQENAGEQYCGMSSHSKLVVHFKEKPSSEEEQACRDYWEGLDEESEEAGSYASAEDIKAASDAMRAGLVSKTWDQMSAAERKMVLGLPVSRQELGV